MRFRRVLAFVLAMIICTCTGAVYAADAPKVSAGGAVLYCENTGQFIFAKSEKANV